MTARSLWVLAAAVVIAGLGASTATGYPYSVSSPAVLSGASPAPFDLETPPLSDLATSSVTTSDSPADGSDFVSAFPITNANLTNRTDVVAVSVEALEP